MDDLQKDGLTTSQVRMFTTTGCSTDCRLTDRSGEELLASTAYLGHEF